jgi:hypothetical protein
MKEERTHHTDDQTDMRKDKRVLKEEFDNDESSHIMEIEEKEKELDSNLKELQLNLEISKKHLIHNYE